MCARRATGLEWSLGAESKPSSAKEKLSGSRYLMVLFVTGKSSWIGLLLLRITPSFLENNLCGRVRYVDLPELEVQIICPLKVSVIVHDEVYSDQFRHVSNVKSPGAALLNNQFLQQKSCNNSRTRTTPIWSCPRMAIRRPCRKMFSQCP